jgi:hypothetical protein
MIRDRRCERFAQIVARARRQVARSFNCFSRPMLFERSAGLPGGADERRKHAASHDPWILARWRSQARVTT